ncbi:aldo/keto reductase [Pusillimonas minor]|uniref:Aldo/keto reductase n=1 Tax=Pusillimonas minor TaxID=2697024 RepID=A0A842HQM0_9BURK|nr:aldo/keto reductase [Pusillimonas minor]MBC2770573.1 aldo/keto reductase [Pusillimonas minor]
MNADPQAMAVGSGAQRLALGTVQFGVPYGVANTGGQVPLETARAMVQFARTNGIDTLDTAIGYGESEQVLGSIGMEDLKVVSKLLPLPASVADAHAWALSKAEASLARLGVKQLHGLLLHRSSDLSGPQGAALYAAMRELQQAGKVRKIGMSIYASTELDAYYGTYAFDLIQAPFNLIDYRLASSGWLSRLKEQGCEVHVRSAFLQGLLLMPRNAIPAKFAPWSALWDRWHAWLAEHDTDAVRACLAYPLSFPEIDRVVVGALDVTQLRQITLAVGDALAASLPDLACEDEHLINPAKWLAL